MADDSYEFEALPAERQELSTFHERAGKKKTSYSAHIPIARQRLEELLKER